MVLEDEGISVIEYEGRGNPLYTHTQSSFPSRNHHTRFCGPFAGAFSQDESEVQELELGYQSVLRRYSRIVEAAI